MHKQPTSISKSVDMTEGIGWKASLLHRALAILRSIDLLCYSQYAATFAIPEQLPHHINQQLRHLSSLPRADSAGSLQPNNLMSVLSCAVAVHVEWHAGLECGIKMGH